MNKTHGQIGNKGRSEKKLKLLIVNACCRICIVELKNILIFWLLETTHMKKKSLFIGTHANEIIVRFNQTSQSHMKKKIERWNNSNHILNIFIHIDNEHGFSTYSTNNLAEMWMEIFSNFKSNSRLLMPLTSVRPVGSNITCLYDMTRFAGFSMLFTTRREIRLFGFALSCCSRLAVEIHSFAYWFTNTQPVLCVRREI